VKAAYGRYHDITRMAAFTYSGNLQRKLPGDVDSTLSVSILIQRFASARVSKNNNVTEIMPVQLVGKLDKSKM